MLPSPSSLLEFDRLVPDEAAAEQIFVQVRWPDGVCCPRCGSCAMTRLSTRPLWQCRDCRLQPSVRSGTVLHRTRIPLRDILHAVWRSATPAGASTRSVAIELGYRYETVFVLLHKMRAALAERGVWQLEAAPVHVGKAEIPAPKPANGDPEGQPPVLVALAIEEEPMAPAVSAVRFEVAPSPDAKEAELLTRALDLHVAPEVQTKVDPRRLAAQRARRGSRPLQVEVHAVVGWLTRRFGGVSRRYMANYLAQYAYVANRWHLRDGLFGWVLRRLMQEPWRPRSDMALLAP